MVAIGSLVSKLRRSHPYELKFSRFVNLEMKVASFLPPIVCLTIVALTIPLPNQHYKVGLEKGLDILQYASKYVSKKYMT